MNIQNLNISDNLLDKSIYRIVPFDRFMESLEQGVNILIRPRLWDDPFENLLTLPSPSKQTKQHENEKYYIYAQCWSFSGENDLLWRTYSKNADSVRIRSTPRKLINSIASSDRMLKIERIPNSIYYDGDVQIDEEIQAFIGKVKYLSYTEITEYIKERIHKNDLNSYFETILIKREAFKNEEELRIGVRHFFEFEDILLRLSDEVFKYDIKINEIIEEVVFDPRISDFKYKGLEEQIKNYGFQNEILKSSLYNIPEIDKILK